ncbi:hypothetical protein HY388_00300 [Candidatus Daviesbacteria bacterium]|nr:hypothetical protein [Candidatus Daviesbacteria bacterium]
MKYPRWLIISIILLLSPVGVFAQATAEPVYPYAFQASPGSQSGQIDITWMDDGSATRYDISYGFGPGQYQWSALAIPFAAYGTSSFTIGYLSPSTTYYLLLTSRKGNDFVTTSGPISSYAAGGTKTKTATSKPKTGGSGPVSIYNFQATTGAKKGTVELSWIDNESANQYAVMFGLKPGQYQWGVFSINEHINSINRFTVEYLTAGTTYYFSLIPKNNDLAKSPTFPISATAR